MQCRLGLRQIPVESGKYTFFRPSLSITKNDPMSAKAPQRSMIVANEQDRPSRLRNFRHLAKAFALEFVVPYRQHFVDNQDFWLKMSGDRKCKTNIHTIAIVLDWRINEFLQASEGDDLFQLPSKVALCNA